MRLFIAVPMLLFLSALAMGHEYWFEPDKFFLKLNEPAALHLYVGEALKKEEERPFQASKTRSLMMYAPTGQFDMRTMAEDEKAPIVNFASNKPGTYSIVMEREWSYIKIDAPKFEDYLRDEGMDYIIAERKRLGESAREGRERYSRFIKTMIQVGDSLTGNAKTRLGSKIEVVPLDNPYKKRVGGSLGFEVWFDGRPLADHAVFADNRDGDSITTQKLKTDKSGAAEVKLGRKGIWLIRVVHMERCERNCGEADWESFWGAYSFGVE